MCERLTPKLVWVSAILFLTTVVIALVSGQLAEVDDTDAQSKHAGGIDVPVVITQGQGIVWLEKAANQGSAEAKNMLGNMYRQGLEVPKDDRKAIEWYQKAADQGFAESQYFIGLMYAVGINRVKDFNKAKLWWLKAAVNGDGTSQMLIGDLYIQEDGTPVDKVLGYAWLDVAARNGADIAASTRDNITAMSASEVDEAKRLSSTWKKGQLIVREVRKTESVDKKPRSHSLVVVL